MRAVALLLFILSFYGTQAQQGSNGQLNKGRRATLGGGVEIGIPVGAFSDTWGREIVGASGTLTSPLRHLPLHWGFDFGWGHMGGERKGILINDPDHQGATGELSVNSKVYGYHGLLRLQPFQGRVSPYFEGMAGLRHFSTRSTMRVDGVSEPLQKERNSSNIIGSVGWAAGVHVSPGRTFYFEARVERLNGGKATYVDPSTIAIGTTGEVSYSTLSSSTRSVQVQMGIGFRF